MLRLGGLSVPHKDWPPGGEDGGMEAAASMHMRPTRERWRGPVDLDAAAAARADEMNATWVASAGSCPRYTYISSHLSMLLCAQRHGVTWARCAFFMNLP